MLAGWNCWDREAEAGVRRRCVFYIERNGSWLRCRVNVPHNLHYYFYSKYERNSFELYLTFHKDVLVCVFHSLFTLTKYPPHQVSGSGTLGERAELSVVWNTRRSPFGCQSDSHTFTPPPPIHTHTRRHTLSSNERDELWLRVSAVSQKVTLARATIKHLTSAQRAEERGDDFMLCVLHALCSEVFVWLYVCGERVAERERGRRNCTHKHRLQPSFPPRFSSSVEPRRRKQDLCHLIKLLYNYLYLQLHEAGNRELMAVWAKQRGRNFYPLLLTVPKTWGQLSCACGLHVLLAGAAYLLLSEMIFNSGLIVWISHRVCSPEMERHIFYHYYYFFFCIVHILLELCLNVKFKSINKHIQRFHICSSPPSF